jgi:hypothetical protein
MRCLAVISVAFGLAGTRPAEACSCLAPTLELGIKIVDTAGNASPPSEVTIDLANANVIP